MKKLVSIFLALLISLSVAGIAEEKIDLKLFKDKEILELRDKINEEISNRKLEKIIAYDESDLISNGSYICDSDIPEGIYTLKIIKNNSYGAIYIKEAEDTYILDAYFNKYKSDGYEYTFNIKKGQTLKVEGMEIATLTRTTKKKWSE
ncbi:MAG: hypothetical protein SPI49_03320 [Eubacteriales bacterium]|nr:hypothetical protein [Eubacteriales bacterium]